MHCTRVPWVQSHDVSFQEPEHFHATALLWQHPVSALTKRDDGDEANVDDVIVVALTKRVDDDRANADDVIVVAAPSERVDEA